MKHLPQNICPGTYLTELNLTEYIGPHRNGDAVVPGDSAYDDKKTASVLQRLTQIGGAERFKNKLKSVLTGS